jgi:hypothetical protein
MKISKTLGTILLGLWLILWGLVSVFGLEIPLRPIVLGIVAIAAGLLLMLGL